MAIEFNWEHTTDHYHSGYAEIWTYNCPCISYDKNSGTVFCVISLNTSYPRKTYIPKGKWIWKLGHGWTDSDDAKLPTYNTKEEAQEACFAHIKERLRYLLGAFNGIK